MSLRDLKIDRGGLAVVGGGIFNEGTLTVSGCTFPNNSAASGGSIFSLGTLIVQDSQIFGTASTGGGIFSRGTLTVRGSRIGGIVNSGGGGIFSDGILEISDSSVGGETLGGGGGIQALGAEVVCWGVMPSGMLRAAPAILGLVLNRRATDAGGEDRG